ncbi:hypothetical protein [Pseudomonas folii]|uniref:Permease n=1 Tax=Pseudomonas folii TaxID=2762593 RepID=A0ABR7B379_9PSED|nr:hypothetical protein [Pseudomonas folii]MBC3951040.1 hypothetical protein [Pseudomonas folii]
MGRSALTNDVNEAVYNEVSNKPSVPDFTKVTMVNSWSVKAYAHPTLSGDLCYCVLFLLSLLALLEGLLGGEVGMVRDFLVEFGSVGVTFYSYMWIFIVRQKTLYKYKIYEAGVELEYYIFYSRYAYIFLKGVAVFVVVCILAMLSIAPWLMLGAIIPASLLIIAAIKLLNWENPVEHHATDWARYDLVFIDRKRKMVVPSFHADPLAGFEVHLEKARIDDFVAFLKTVIPHAEFREAEWKW